MANRSDVDALKKGLGLLLWSQLYKLIWLSRFLCWYGGAVGLDTCFFALPLSYPILIVLQEIFYMAITIS